MKTKELPKPYTAAWLKELREALRVPTYQVTPSSRPASIARERLTDMQLKNLMVARSMIGCEN